jgi:hypothetical protein
MKIWLKVVKHSLISIEIDLSQPKMNSTVLNMAPKQTLVGIGSAYSMLSRIIDSHRLISEITITLDLFSIFLSVFENFFTEIWYQRWTGQQKSQTATALSHPVHL